MSAVASTVETCLDSARALESDGNVEDALALYQRVLEITPSAWIVRSKYLRLMYQLDRITEMEQNLVDYLAKAESAAAQNDLGVIKAEQGEYLEAARLFIQAQRAELTLPGSLILGNLAYVLCMTDRREEGAKICEKALHLDPEDPRTHYVLSVLESRNYESRMRPVSRVAYNNNVVEAFRLLRFEGESMVKYKAKIVGDESGQVEITESVPPSRSGTQWGILAKYADEMWCGFAMQSTNADVAAPAMPVPGEFSLIQRRRWVRVVATGGVSGLTVRSFPPGVEPFQLEEVTELNLSGGGAAVRTKPELPRGTTVTLHLNLENENIEVHAQVARISRPHTAKPYSALTFLDLDENLRERIARYVHVIQLDRKRGTT